MSIQPSRFRALSPAQVDALFQAQAAAALLARLNHQTIPGPPIDADQTIPGPPIDADQTAAVAAYIAAALDGVIDAVTG